ncbi:hypothetical protein [Desulfonatronum thioautotrophicum]|uniref:hypothetical protein n=1 Tax=Desulfonatronum thioautotrophicum TaxID=617001 RepID=UPI0012947BD9|nr:hypothetical protein [Desulfonatronum thioautotrophicum]
MHWIEKIFRYLSQGMDIDQGVVHDLIKTHVPSGKEEIIMTIAEQWKQARRLEGRLEGRMEGRGEIVQRLFIKRFGKNILNITIRRTPAKGHARTTRPLGRETFGCQER